MLFLTAYGICHGFELLALGDSRSGAFNENFEKTGLIINDAIDYVETNSGGCDGILMTGDYVSSGRVDEDWDTWIEVNERAFGYPIYPCIGNHDDEPRSLPWWLFLLEWYDYYSWNYFDTFGVERWYSTTIRDAVHIVSIDSTLEGFDLLTFDGDILEFFQYQWFVKELKRNRDMFTIVIFHEPAYGSHSWDKGHGSNRFMRQRYATECEKYDVEMVLNGHNHWYERVFINDVYHITTGGGGAPLLPDTPFPSDWVEGSQVIDSAYHYLTLSVDEEGIDVFVESIKYNTGEILDSVLIERR
jgi:hypothetical protein